MNFQEGQGTRTKLGALKICKLSPRKTATMGALNPADLKLPTQVTCSPSN